jgi:hypothetical protein
VTTPQHEGDLAALFRIGTPREEAVDLSQQVPAISVEYDMSFEAEILGEAGVNDGSILNAS